MKKANVDFHKKQYSAAARKYEEAYSVWRYFKSDNPNWNTEGIDDTQLDEVDWWGNNDEERELIREHKVTALLNICACSLKAQAYQDALDTVNEALKIDPTNRTGLERRAKALAFPVNASVEDYKDAIKDLKAIGSDKPRILKEIKRLQDAA